MLWTLRRALRDKVVRAVREAVDPVLADHRERLLRELAAQEHRRRFDLGTALDAEAVASSAALVRSSMDRARACGSPGETLVAGLEAAQGPGMVLEFGVAAGSSLRVLVEHARGREVFGFDVFSGLPEHWRLGFGEGMFAQDALPDVPGAQLVPGLFDQTLPAFLAEHPGPVAFVHADADLYSSTATVLEHVGPRLGVGSVVVFDEYFNYPRWQDHEHRAWTEWLAATGATAETLAFTWDGQQVAVRITGAPRT